MNNQIENSEYILATTYLKKYNIEFNSNKILSEFLSNSSTKNMILLIHAKNNGVKPYFTKKGKHGGGTWMHPDLFQFFHNWLYKIPNKTFSRDEFEFCSAIEESFKDILKFDRQKTFLINYKGYGRTFKRPFY